MAPGDDSETGDSTGPICADCRGGPVIIFLDAIPLCDRCHDARIAEATGWPRLPEPPPPETIIGPDGRRHRIVYRVWRSPAGIAVEASEGDESFEGYYAELVGTHESDIETLVAQAKVAIRQRIARQDLVLSPSGSMIMAGTQLCGRLVWHEGAKPYGVVVDGRKMSWHEFGLAMEPFEGWEFRISFDEDMVEEDEPGRSEDASATELFPVPDERTH